MLLAGEILNLTYLLSLFSGTSHAIDQFKPSPTSSHSRSGLYRGEQVSSWTNKPACQRHASDSPFAITSRVEFDWLRNRYQFGLSRWRPRFQSIRTLPGALLTALCCCQSLIGSLELAVETFKAW
jgi:hypothetical protein